MSEILREYIRNVIKESPKRISLGDSAQKRIAAWFVQKGMVASVNRPGSSSSDIVVTSPSGNSAKIESKNSVSGKLIYAHELVSGSEIATAMKFTPGSIDEDLSLERFKPAKNGKPIDDSKAAESIRDDQNKIIKQRLDADGDTFEVLFGGRSLNEEKLGKGKGVQFIKSLKTDGSIVIKDGDKFRPVLIVITPKDNKKANKTRLRVWAEGSSKLRSALGGKGKQELGTYTKISDQDLTAAWKADYSNDDYFAIVTGDSMCIGTVNSNDPLGLGVGELTVKLSMPTGGRTMAYGGTNISGIREKIMIEIDKCSVVKIPDISTANDYQEQGKITVR